MWMGRITVVLCNHGSISCSIQPLVSISKSWRACVCVCACTCACVCPFRGNVCRLDIHLLAFTKWLMKSHSLTWMLCWVFFRHHCFLLQIKNIYITVLEIGWKCVLWRAGDIYRNSLQQAHKVFFLAVWCKWLTPDSETLLCGLHQSTLRWSAAQSLPECCAGWRQRHRWPWCWRHPPLCAVYCRILNLGKMITNK